MIETAIALVFLIPALAAAFYYFALVLLARFPANVRSRSSPATRFAVLVPAHDEALGLPATLRSVLASDYPRELIEVFVVADNCSDDTATVARGCQATAIERHDPSRRGKGYALEFALNAILPSQPDVVLMLDADGELDAKAIRIFDAMFATAAEAVQGSIRTRNAADGASGLAAAVGNVLDDAVAAGLDRLGGRVRLRGSNMAFRRELLERIPWNCHGLTEDAEYSAKLQQAGVRVRFAAAAKARSESPGRLKDLESQRRRWSAALRGPRDWLASKPLVLGHLMLTTAIVPIAAALIEFEKATPLLTGLVAAWLMTLAVYAMALLQVGTVRALFGVPFVVLKLLSLSVGRRELHWRRTRRMAEG